MTPPRRFTLIDAMILVAAVATGTALGRPLIGFVGLLRSRVGQFDLPTHFLWWPVLAAPWLAALTLAAIALNAGGLLRQPLRAVLRPGMAGCLAAALGLAAGTLARGYGRILIGAVLRRRLRASSLHYAWATAGDDAGLAAFATWVVLLATGRWRGEPDWHDRLGRAASLGWVALLALRLAGDLLRFRA
jgi:hypothetical protein